MARKMTSITLIAVMVAGSITVAAPGFVLAVHAEHNDDLFVSAEETGNRVVGPQIVEIAVIGGDLLDTAIPPDVTLDGNAVAMTAAIDGNWYAYVADAGQVAAVYGDSENPGTSFGTTDNCTSRAAMHPSHTAIPLMITSTLSAPRRPLTLITPNGLSYRHTISHLTPMYSTARQAAPKPPH